MRHMRSMAVRRADAEDPAFVVAVLDRIFGFVLTLVDSKGKGPSETES